MSKKKKHRVKTHSWKDGVLETQEYIFESLEEAMEFLKTVEYYMAKIYDELDILVIEIGGSGSDTYA
jgi:hypothetical protein